MGKYHLSKDEAGDLLEHMVRGVTTSQELSNITKNFMKLAGGYLVEYSPLCCYMATWPCHIDRFEQ